MICVVDNKRRFIVHFLNLVGLFFYPFYAISRRKWSKKRRANLELSIANSHFDTIAINMIARLGDILVAVPFIRALKRKYNVSKIIIFTNHLGKEVLLNNPYIDEIIIADNYWVWSTKVNLSKFIKSFNAGYWRQIKDLRARKYDLLIELMGDFRNIIFFDIWLKSDYLVGQTFSGFGWLFDLEIEYAKGSHEIDIKLNVAKELGAKSLNRELEFYLTKDDRQEAGAFYNRHQMEPGDLVAVFHIGGTWEPRIWPLKNFAAIAKKLMKEYQAKIILIGDKRDKNRIDEFLKIIPEAFRADGMSIKQSAALLERADLFLGNDSGPMHLARSVGTPIVALFGPETPQRFGIEDAGITVINSFPCQPCGQIKCKKTPNCIESITVEQVWEGIEDALKHRQTPINYRRLPSVNLKTN